MIPADHFQLNDDGTHAWWVLPTMIGQPFVKFPDGLMDVRTAFDGPCDTCGGSGVLGASTAGPGVYQDCADCDGTGRHTFTVEVADPDRPEGWPFPHQTHRVHVVPGMVGQIVRGPCPTPTNAKHRPMHVHLAGRSDEDHTQAGICHWDADPAWDSPWKLGNVAHLPSAAKPGMYAVRLEVHP